ncbi:MAG TPA: hypothetical protein VHG08_03630 [Longimicrobium sp.]|nr:hypothetical protein [Longimicrobium sp.]
MRKLSVNPEQLRVQSFTADEAPAARAGTVHAREAATVTCVYPRCGTVMARESCYNGCTCDDC